MTFAEHLVAEHFRRTGQAGSQPLDGAHQYQVSVLRDLLGRLEIILEDEMIDSPKAERIMRCLLYGAPGRADAELRVQQQERTTELLARRPIGAQTLADLGLPPR